MSLLELEHVGKSYPHGSHRVQALRDVTLALLEGELVAVWGLRASGRSTLLRLAAGLETPDSGTIRFHGQDLARLPSRGLAAGIGYCRRPAAGHEAHGQFEARSALEELMVIQLARGLGTGRARARSLEVLDRAGARACAHLRPSELEDAEASRVMIAKALSMEPVLLLLDEPTSGVDLLERDGIFDLLRSLAREDGIAVLACIGEGTGLFGVDRGLTLSEGELHGSLTPEVAPVVALPQPQSA